MRKLALARNPFGGSYASFSQVPRNINATGASVPAPIEGWDAQSPIAAMSPKRAVRLINWFPQPDWVELRRGHQQHVNTGTLLPVESLMSYQGVIADKMFAASNGKIFDVTNASGATPAASVSGLANSRFQYVNYATTGGHFLYLVNGANIPQYYDGSVWATATITGIDPTTIIGVNNHKNRLWFTLTGSTNAAYLATDAIQGAATTFPLGGLFNLGGFLMAMGTWTIDGGNGSDDYAVFVSSEGQVAIYQGSNPAAAATWSLIGVFDMGPPIGRRCLIKIGADIAIISIDGVIPLSKALIFERSAVVKASLTERIQRVMNKSARSYKDNFGWQLIPYPRGTRAILNVPVQEGVEQEQYVMNTIHGAWCRFTGMNANVWETLDDRLYFGGNNGVVYEADRGGTDVGSVLRADMMTAFNYFNSRGQQKKWGMCRPLLTTDSAVQPGLAFNVDFHDDAPIFVPSTTAIQQALWDTAVWDTDIWAGSVATKGDWTTVAGIGYCASIRMVVDINHPNEGEAAIWGESLWGVGRWGELDGPEVTLQVNGFDLVYQRGGFI